MNTLHGIIDACKKNLKYANIISTLNIAVESVPCVLDQVQEWLQKHRNIKGIFAADVLKFINAEYADITDEMEWQEKDDDTTKQQLEIIHMWRWSKANINKIATRLQVPLSMVRIAIKKYKLKAKAMLRRNKACSNKRRKLIDYEGVQRMDTFCTSNSHKLLTIEDIQNSLWSRDFSNAGSYHIENVKERKEAIPSKSTIARTLKRELKMSYKVVNLKHSKTQTIEHKKGYLESVLLHNRLILSKYEMIYIGEFSLSYRNNIHRGWAFKNQRPNIIANIEGFSMYFIIAASDIHFYGIIGNEGSNNQHTFIHFLWNVLKARSDDFKINSSKFLFIIDNASIHKTSSVADLAKEHKIKLLTIPPYSPSLNAAEYFIQSIKSKMKRTQRFGRYECLSIKLILYRTICLKLIEDVIKEI